jgi:mono/diheme cytochrome c family protein
MPFLARALLLAGAALGAAHAPAALAQDATLKRGQYLSRIMDCGGCHTPGQMAGKPDPAKLLAGSPLGFEVPGLGVFFPANLTPDAETGLGKWTEAQLVAAFTRGARPDGRELAPAMPWRAYAALTDADAKALAKYLKSLPAVRQAIPAPVGPGEKAEAPYLTVKAPN